MTSLEPKQPVIVRRHKKVRFVVHHGGAWKVAMADFALAMMALFIVLWVISNANQEAKEAISGYFKDPLAYKEGRRSPSPFAIDLGGSPTVLDKTTGAERSDPNAIVIQQGNGRSDSYEQRRREEVKDQLEQAIESSPTLSPFSHQLLVDITTDGVRLQLVDQTERTMFSNGSAQLRYYTEDILWELAPVLSQFNRRLSITGHTDSSLAQDTADEDDVNWLLSASRADAARRALMEAGVRKKDIAQVIGMGDTAPLKPDAPDSPINRRVSITLLNPEPRDNAPQREQDQTGRNPDDAVKNAVDTVNSRQGAVPFNARDDLQLN